MRHRSTTTIRRGRLGRVAAVAVAVTVVALGATGCETAPTRLEIAYDDRSGTVVRYTVTCGTDQATITPAVAGLDATRACAVAEAQATLLTEGPPAGRYCGQVYFGAQRARVRGVVDEVPVDLPLGRNDSCRESDWRSLTGLVLRP